MFKRLLIGVLILICGALSWVIFINMEFYDETVNLGWSSHAKRNPYLAAERFLESRVDAIESRSLLTEFDGSKLQTIIVPNANFLQLPSTQRAIMTWVSEGGHLIIGAGRAEQPPLLKDLGFRVKHNPYSENDDSDEEELSFADTLRQENERIRKNYAREENIPDEDQNTTCLAGIWECNASVAPEINDEELTQLSFNDEEFQSSVYFNSKQYLLHEEFSSLKDFDDESYPDIPELYEKPDIFYWTGHAHGTSFVQLEYGSGMMSIGADLEIFDNAHISHFDHAYVLDNLNSDKDSVLILYGKHVPPLSTLLYRCFPEALTALSILLIACLLYFGRRFGRAIDLLAESRRSRTERFSAVGQFYWRTKNDNGLILHLRQDITKRACRHWQDFSNWPAEQQAQRLAKHLDMPIDSINSAINDELTFNENQFTSIIQTLQKLRKNL